MDNTIFNKGVRIPSSLYLGVPGLTDWKTENTSVGYEFKHRFDNGWKLNSNARYMHSDVDYNWAFYSVWPYRLSNGHYADIMVQKRPKATDTFLTDNNISGVIETGPLQHNLLFGVDYRSYTSKETRTNSMKNISTRCVQS